MRKLVLLLVFLVAVGWASTAGARHAQPCVNACVTELSVPTPVVYNGPFGIAEGGANHMWFGDQDALGRVGNHGAIDMFTVPTAGAGVGWVTPIRDKVWFTERFTNKLGSLNASRRFAEYTIPTPDSTPQGLVEGPDKNLWFTEQDGNNIGRLSRGGAFTEYPVPTPAASPLGLTVGPDGALWFVERDASQIGRIDMAGHFTEYPLAPDMSPQRITAGSDGALWFSELAGNQIGRITTSGAITAYPLTPGSGPVGITARDDGVWFVEFSANKVAQMGYDGTVEHEWSIPTASSSALQLSTGPDSTIWFTERTGNKVGRLTPFARSEG
jgi:virginiamycin B lyase